MLKVNHKNNMTLKNALKKIEKAGLVAKEVYGGTYQVKHNDYVLEFSRNGSSEDIVCIGTRHVNDKSDSMTDYCAFFWHDNLSQGLRSLLNK